MSNITQGMNIEEVRRLGADLEAYATKVEAMIRRVERSVTAVTWEGPDARAFKNDWWPGHRTRLDNIVKDLRGFGQSAKNNAEEQERASGVKGGGTSSGGGTTTTPTSPPNSGTSPGSGFGHRSSDEAKAIADRYIKPEERSAYDFDGIKDGQGDWYQCTVWAKARWRQMAEERGVAIPDWRGNGNEVAHNINLALGRPDSHDPTPGAIVSMGGSDHPHVAVVEEVRVVNGVTQFRISEMNTGYVNGVKVNEWNVASAAEYSDSRWLNAGPGYTFAAFPG